MAPVVCKPGSNCKRVDTSGIATSVVEALKPVPGHTPVPRGEKIYIVLASTFIVLLVLTNIIGIKLFYAPFGDFALTSGIITYPLTFLVTDVVSEIYGKRRADFMVIIGFVMSMLMLLLVQAAVALPPHPFWVPTGEGAFYDSPGGYQHAYESVFGLNGLLVFASMLAYLCAQLTDNWLFHFWRRLTKGKHLWLRNNGSTVFSQLLDTLIVNSILFYIGFGMGFTQGLQIMMTVYVYKLSIALLDTPLVYVGVWLVRRALPREA